MIDLSLTDPLAAAVEHEVRDVFDVQDLQVRTVRGQRIIVLTGSFLRSSEMVYRTVSPRLRRHGLLTLLRQEGNRDLIVAQPAPEIQPRRRTWINALLFVLTVISTVLAGAFQELPDSAVARIEASVGDQQLAWRLVEATLENWSAGVPFMLALLGILGVHEFGHYLTARRYGLPVSLPYFIPFPNYLTGTMGAVIRIDGPFESRRALFDVGIAGPLAGLAVAIPVTIAGLMQAEIVPVVTGGGGISFQEPVLFRALAYWIVGPRPPGTDLAMNSLMMAGWWGLLVTAINLFPVSQLDGGHISYALFGRAHRWVAWGMYGLAIAVTLSNAESMAYVLMLGLVLLMGITHPPALDDVTPVGPGRRLLGLATLAAFFLLITPQPLQMMP